jgi:S1-C subfamily serine protease
MRHKLNLAFFTLACLLAIPATPSRADELADTGRDIFKKNQHAVVTVEVVQKMSYTAPGRASSSQESKQDLTGTVVDPSGLTVLALSACDPAEMYRRTMGENYNRYKVETEVSDLKILLDDGTEMPAEIVLRDKDLDLAFIRPKTKPATPMAAIDLSKAASAQILEQVITVNRLGRAAGRAYAASVERISAVVQKPRTFYIPDISPTSTALGSPAFSLNGNILGVVVLRTVNSSGGENTRENLSASIILPAADILKGAAQAPETKGGDEKKEPAKDSKEAPKETKEQK